MSVVAEVRLVHLRLFLLLSSAGPAVGSAGRSPQLPDFTAREKCGTGASAGPAACSLRLLLVSISGEMVVTS